MRTQFGAVAAEEDFVLGTIQASTGWYGFSENKRVKFWSSFLTELLTQVRNLVDNWQLTLPHANWMITCTAEGTVIIKFVFFAASINNKIHTKLLSSYHECHKIYTTLQ